MTGSKRPRQEIMRERLSELPADAWYAARDQSERTTLAFMRKRGIVQERLENGRCVYRLWRPELELGRFGATVADLNASVRAS